MTHRLALLPLALLLRLAWSLAASADPSEDEFHCAFAEHLCRC